MGKRLFSQKGQVFVEMLFVVPLLLLFLCAIFEFGFIMHDFAIVNYAASSAAVESARKGYFDNDVYTRTADYLRNWTSGGSDLGIGRAVVTANDPANIVVWGPDAATQIQRGNMVTVGVTYPVHFKLFFMDAMCHWVIEDNTLTLKTRATAMGEQYFE